MEYINKQVEARAKAWEEAKSLLDAAASESRDLNGEEQQKYDRIMQDLDARAKTIETLRADAQREERAAASRVEAEIRTDKPQNDESELFRKLARGEVRSATFGPSEKRDVLKTNTGAPIPTSFYDQLIEHMVVVGPMLETSTIIRTQGGENLQIPRTNAYSSATATAEGSAIGESDPTFQSFLTLSAYKFSFLTQISSEMLEDTGVDILGFLARQAGIAMGVSVNNKLTLGTGTVEPTGIITSAGTGVTGGTGVAGAFSGDNLIDLSYSVNSVYRRMPGTGWMMNSNSLSAVRKLKDNENRYLFEPSLQAGQPDRLLGYSIYENPDMANAGTVAKSVLFGHLPTYHVRQVRDLSFVRSDEFAFANDLVTFRAILRLDGGLPQQGAVNVFRGGTA
jgi:HK97 family phage major capsid protein